MSNKISWTIEPIFFDDPGKVDPSVLYFHVKSNGPDYLRELSAVLHVKRKTYKIARIIIDEKKGTATVKITPLYSVKFSSFKAVRALLVKRISGLYGLDQYKPDLYTAN